MLSSTTGSSTSSPSPRTALIACGAIAQPAGRIVEKHNWPVDVHPLPPLLHNQPQKIAGEVARLAESLASSYDSVVVGYADCGTYGALDEVCERLGLRRLEGLHCYDVYAGASRIEVFFADQPGTYLLTDFLVKSFARTIETELGLDRWPELRDEYFRHYTRVVWLAQDETPELRAARRGRCCPARPPAHRRTHGQRRPREGLGAARHAVTVSPDVRGNSGLAGNALPASPQICPPAQPVLYAGAQPIFASSSWRQVSVAAIWLNVKTCRPSMRDSGFIAVVATSSRNF